MEQKLPTPLKSIRFKCLECCCDSPYEVKLCTATNCPLYPYRFGKNPNRTGLKNKGSFTKNNGSTNDSEKIRETEGKDTTQEFDSEISGQMSLFDKDYGR